MPAQRASTVPARGACDLAVLQRRRSRIVTTRGRRSRTRALGCALDAPGGLFENPFMPDFAFRLGLAACAAAALVSAAAAKPRDPLYQWTDGAGVVRYTTEIERIPIGRRDAAVIVAGAHTAVPAEKPTARSAAQPAAPAQPAAAPPAPTDPAVAALDAQIAELEQRIAADEAALGDYISDPEREKGKTDPSEKGKTDPNQASNVAEIANRLPKLQNELRDLRRQRDAAAAAAAGAPAAAPNANP
jgi:hypothetical protein